MKIEQQVTSLEISKRLKELGVKQESLFWWEQIKTAGKNEWTNWQVAFVNNSPHYNDGRTVSAFTVAELGEMLPSEIANEYLSCYRVHLLHGTTDEHDEWECGYGKALAERYFTADTEADARGLILIHLLEKKLI